MQNFQDTFETHKRSFINLHGCTFNSLFFLASFFSSYFLQNPLIPFHPWLLKGVFKTLSEISDGVFWLIYVIYCRKKAPSQIFDWILNKHLCNILCTKIWFLTNCWDIRVKILDHFSTDLLSRKPLSNEVLSRLNINFKANTNFENPSELSFPLK